MDAEHVIIMGIIDRRRDQMRVSPSWIATEAMIEIGEITVNTAPISYRLAHLQARQIAREYLRKTFEPDGGGIGAPDDLFPELQWRYPTNRDVRAENPEYVLRDQMSDDDIMFNVRRLRSEADAKNKHADALEAWGLSRRPGRTG